LMCNLPDILLGSGFGCNAEQTMRRGTPFLPKSADPS
jgi:hypothetical protein